MQPATDILQELRELDSRLADLPKLQPFQLPVPGYLDELPPQLSAGVQAAAAADPQPQWGMTPPFDVPAGYFETLSHTLLEEVTAASGLPTTLPYAAPEGYLAQLPAQLMAGVQASEQSAPRSRPFRPAIRRIAPWLAAAAVMAGVWFGLGRGPAAVTPDAATSGALATLNRDTIGAYVELHADEFDPELLEEAIAGSLTTDLREALSDLPESEIETYLNETDAEPRGSGGS